MERPIKVLMTADAVGGVWTYALDLATGLAARDVAMTLAVLGPAPSEAQRRGAEAVSGMRVVETGLPLEWTAENATQIGAAGRAIAELAAETGCDLVHLNSPALAGAARFPCPVLAVCHSCLSTWWSAVRGGEPPDDFAWRTDLIRAGYGGADLLIAPTTAFARASAEAYSLAEEPRVVHNGRAARPEIVAGEGRAKPFVLTAGRLWDDGKNIAALDRIAGRLSAPVLAAGPTSGPNGAAIELRHIEVLGQVDTEQLDRLFASRPIFASLAHYEPFGLAVLEAAQAGCPLVLSDIPTFRELWDGAALFVDSRDEDEAASALFRLLSDPADAERLGDAARERASRYTLYRMVDGVAAAYRDLLGRNGSRSILMSAA